MRGEQNRWVEPTLELTAAAIANAIRNATGKDFYNLPINLEGSFASPETFS
ncbi:MAG: hypothetical protein MZV64_37245 [Ignavibacteriales bacterium]|nr:hypothetical protein [Ignavibacteriales bacterium]